MPIDHYVFPLSPRSFKVMAVAIHRLFWVLARHLEKSPLNHPFQAPAPDCRQLMRRSSTSADCSPRTRQRPPAPRLAIRCDGRFRRKTRAHAPSKESKAASARPRWLSESLASMAISAMVRSSTGR